MKEPRKHPSGRPIREDIEERRLGFYRLPPDEPLTPGLRPGRRRTEAIGFHVHIPRDEEED